MVLSEFLSDMRRHWVKALKLLKRSKHRKSVAAASSPRHNRVTPSKPTRECPPYSGTVDASADIAVERFCRCDAVTPRFPAETLPTTCENLSYCSDSAYDTDRSSPSSLQDTRDIQKPVYEVSFYLKECSRDSDTCSVTTEVTWLELELEDAECESRQNMFNERLELMTTL